MSCECNCPSCRGEGPPDDETPEPSEDFIASWIEEHNETIVDRFADQIQEDWEKYLSGALEDAAISSAEALPVREA